MERKQYILRSLSWDGCTHEQALVAINDVSKIKLDQIVDEAVIEWLNNGSVIIIGETRKKYYVCLGMIHEFIGEYKENLEN